MNRFGVSHGRLHRLPGAACGPRQQAQRGGTVLGFVFGVLVGLAVALGVAVYVTKVPVPFVDRVISRNAADDAAEAERNKNWDPNAVLQGGRAKPSGAEVSPVAAPNVPTDKPELLPPPPKKAATPMPAAGESHATSAPANASTAPAAAPTAAPKGKTYSSSPDPLGDLANQQAQGKSFGTAKATPGAVAAPAAAASGPAETFVYFVQVGAYRTPEDAQSQRARLVLMGLDAAISEREQAGRTVYRVRLGPYERQADAEKMKTTLEPGGFDAALVRVQR